MVSAILLGDFDIFEIRDYNPSFALYSYIRSLWIICHWMLFGVCMLFLNQKKTMHELTLKQANLKNADLTRDDQNLDQK